LRGVSLVSSAISFSEQMNAAWSDSEKAWALKAIANALDGKPSQSEMK
jgi:hypothetical protein